VWETVPAWEKGSEGGRKGGVRVGKTERRLCTCRHCMYISETDRDRQRQTEGQLYLCRGQQREREREREREKFIDDQIDD
jgi:hypothetical protein